MTERTARDNQTLTAFWNQTFAMQEEEKEAILKADAVSIEDFAPAEKPLKAAYALGGRRRVLDYGCGAGWAAVAAAKSGCKDVTAADVAPNAAEAARFLAGLFGVEERLHAVCCSCDWLKTVPAETYDGFFCSNVLDTVPPETAEEILREAARVVTKDAFAVIGLNYYMTPEAAAEKGLELSDGCMAYQDGVLRLVSHTDAEWEAIFAPYFAVERLEYFAWPGEEEETRRLFFLRRN